MLNTHTFRVDLAEPGSFRQARIHRDSHEAAFERGGIIHCIRHRYTGDGVRNAPAHVFRDKTHSAHHSSVEYWDLGQLLGSRQGIDSMRNQSGTI